MASVSKSCTLSQNRGGSPCSPDTPPSLWQDATKSSVTSAGCCHFFGSRYSSRAPPPPMLVFSPRRESCFCSTVVDPHLPSSCVAAGRDIKLAAAVIKIVSRRPILLGPAQSRPGWPAEPISFINGGSGRLADGAGGWGSPCSPVSRCDSHLVCGCKRKRIG